MVIHKILESVIISDKMFEDLLRNNLLSNQQHGFVPKHTTSYSSQLLDRISREIKGTPVDVVYL